MHRAPSKRRQRAQLMFVYSLMVLAVVSLVAILVLLVQGYRFNQFDGKIEQGGLIQFRSRPDGAAVLLDGMPLANKTPSKLTVSAGSHMVTIQRDGYTTWQKNIIVKPGGVLWLDYMQLYPTILKATVVANTPAVTDALVSPDRRQAVLTSSITPATLTLVPLNEVTPQPTNLVIPVSAYTAPIEGQTQLWQLVAWDKESRFVIIRHVIEAAASRNIEYLSVDTHNIGTTYNISKQLGVDITDVIYNVRNNNQLYVLTTDNEVRRADMGASTLTGPLLTNVSEFSQYDDGTLLYSSIVSPTGQTAGYLSDGATKAKVIVTLPMATAAPLLHVGMGTYYGQRYLAVARAEQTEILTGTLPASDSTAALQLKAIGSLPLGSGKPVFSPGKQRYVTLRSGPKFVSYDLELGAIGTVTLPSDAARAPYWLDADHIAVVADAALVSYDYDGTNKQTLAVDAANLPATFSENGQYLCYFKTQGSETILARIKLVP